ncbi:uncharacterized protein LOC123527468 [Mercenaria mercenaria]|uniref:uncharacterized protein LOC123527468 n=1 Tax=Mercenaria mercenaria TaxID=6596 RepID=UPI00234ECDAF|nr:uncharacterized protein LOC123527468 [Mercenaria mercenaria]
MLTESRKMFIISLLALGVLAGISDGQPVSNCTDLDTNACILFHKAKPNLCSIQTYSADSCKRFCGNCPLQCYMCPTPVLDPNDCNTTTSCATGEKCLTKHLMAPDGHHEYIMTCGSADICQGTSLGFQSSVIGKRAMADEPDNNSHQRYERDILISCCDTDFCNMPTTATTYIPTPPASSMPTTPTTYLTPPGSLPNGCNRDIVFVLDSSGSVGSSNFGRVLNFVKDIVRQLNIGPTKAQVAMATFSSQTTVNWYLNRHTSKQDLLTAVGNVSYHSGGTQTSNALKTIREKVFTQAHGDRQLAKNLSLF